MAEGWARFLKEDLIDPYSAGIRSRELDPVAVKVMAEEGVDISGQHSKHIDELIELPFDYVVTVCSHAQESCPVFPGKTRVVHRGFEDPQELAKKLKNGDEILGHYRRIRDEIKAFVQRIPDELLEREEN